jgi:cytochrome c peroxidase
VLASPFNCRSEYSAATDKSCPNLEFIRISGSEITGAFKTPSLRNLNMTGPYMHDGRFATLREVLDHYNRAPVTYRLFGHTEIFPLGMTGQELADLEAFLRALSPDSIK